MPHEQDKTVAEANGGGAPAEAPSAQTGLTVYFDGSCPLCTAEISHYAAQRGGDTLEFVDVSREDSQIGADLKPGDAMRRFHVRTPDGSLVSGARAFVAIWHALPGWKWAARLAGLPGMPTVLEGAYRLFLPVRPVLSKIASVLGARPANTCRGDDCA